MREAGLEANADGKIELPAIPAKTPTTSATGMRYASASSEGQLKLNIE